MFRKTKPWLDQEQTSLNSKGAKLKLYKEDEVAYHGKDYWDGTQKLVHIHMATLCELLEIKPELQISYAVTVEKVPSEAVMAVQDMRTGAMDYTAQYYGGKFASEHWGIEDIVGGDLGQSSEAYEAHRTADAAREEQHYRNES